MVSGASSKILDGLAGVMAAIALCVGLLCAPSIGLFCFAWLFQGRSFRSLVWALTDDLTGLGYITQGLALAVVLGVSAMALARRSGESSLRRRWLLLPHDWGGRAWRLSGLA